MEKRRGQAEVKILIALVTVSILFSCALELTETFRTEADIAGWIYENIEYRADSVVELTAALNRPVKGE